MAGIRGRVVATGRSIITVLTTTTVLALAGILVLTGESLWGLAATLAGLSAVFVAAARWEVARRAGAPEIRRDEPDIAIDPSAGPPSAA